MEERGGLKERKERYKMKRNDVVKTEKGETHRGKKGVRGRE